MVAINLCVTARGRGGIPLHLWFVAWCGAVIDPSPLRARHASPSRSAPIPAVQSSHAIDYAPFLENGVRILITELSVHSMRRGCRRSDLRSCFRHAKIHGFPQKSALGATLRAIACPFVLSAMVSACARGHANLKSYGLKPRISDIASLVCLNHGRLDKKTN